jgi:hypothetical protein
MESGREGGTAEQTDTVICSEVLSGYPVLFFKLYLPFPYERNRLLFMFTSGGVYCKTKTGGRGNRCPAAWFVQAYSLYKRVRYFNSILSCSGCGIYVCGFILGVWGFLSSRRGMWRGLRISVCFREKNGTIELTMVP